MTTSRALTGSRRKTPPAPHAQPHCPTNDCQRLQAEALTRLAETTEAFHAEYLQLKPTLHNIGEIAGKWLRFCAFVRKWFPRVGWWLIPIAVTLLTKGSGEATDALIHALSQALAAWTQSQTGG